MKKALQLSVMSLALVGFSSALVGCGAQPGTTVVKYSGELEEQIQEVGDTATYNLYGSRDLEPLLSIKLEEGELIGFKKVDGKKVIAVYGEREMTLEGELLSTYRWKKQK
ncbi:MAG: hypothetical protein AAGD32_14060 [Planctomycetota bacterium]